MYNIYFYFNISNIICRRMCKLVDWVHCLRLQWGQSMCFCGRKTRDGGHNFCLLDFSSYLVVCLGRGWRRRNGDAYEDHYQHET